ncbi:MAG: ankyrin repeat domain-containing protein, partial [Amoebophilaceae bacterium]|nr:ankyrin repeat domain-containing protein [Amoebophilaceae bacterium]
MKPYFFYLSLNRIGLLLTMFMLCNSTPSYATSNVPHNPNLNKPNQIVNNPLIWAIESNDLPKMIALIRDKQYINSADFIGYSPLHYAVKRANIVAIKLLIQAKAVLDQVSIKNGNTPLLLAIESGHKKVAALLLESGANPNIMNHQGYNALHLAIQYKRKELVQLLLATGSCCNTPTGSAESPLVLAIKAESIPIIKLLLHQKKITGSQDQEGYGELHWAVKTNAAPIFRLLLQAKKFNIDGQTHKGVTPLHLIVSNPKTKPILLRDLLHIPLLQINTPDITGSTPLHYAVAANQLKVANSLLSYPYIDTN